MFADADCCVTPILPMREALEDPQFCARGMIVDASDATGPVPQFAPPLKLSEFEFAVARQAPRPGEHSDEILHEAGYGSDGYRGVSQRGPI